MTARKQILVTGGAGYIGSHMVLALLDAGETPVVLDNLSTGTRLAVPADVPFYEGDCGDPSLVESIIRERDIDTIIHFAASIVVPVSVADPLAYYENNTVKSRSLIERAVRAGVSTFIFSSTAAVYGNPESVPVREDSLTSPINPYGRSKLMTEWMLSDTAHARPLKYFALRYFNVAGADPAGRSGQSSPDATHLIKVAVQAATGKRSGMDVFGTDYPTPDGSCVRDYVHVSDLAQAHLDALRHLRGGGESAVSNIGYGHGFSVLEVIEAVKKESGVDFEVRLKDRRSGDPAVLVASNERAQSLLKWTPRYDSLPVIIRDALAWERKLSERLSAGRT
ncbi:UDP-glucose 4-epimerase GalE [Bradyrhizobium sp. LHD-71]|uniref:UDP-glucose 4-epimerase GalE n=1 Tax=Bradyrhizobium sp. LHD-71 TaxID=3072141 RepID=UPI00280C9C6A|nr:UDP-glucose 4-epimerase GalE [Bradyrhizobium sp. LHD-71]MDQ8726673.1 UDP-glucose 4-epimerase GalE [Bradyrhizobium sp. LHD-71]